MNSRENIIETIRILDTSNAMLQEHARVLALLHQHSLYGERVCEILDGIQEYHKKVILLGAEVLEEYGERYGEEMQAVDELTNDLLGELGEANV